MEEWYTSDEIWSIQLTAKTREDFVQNWVIKGLFHEQVPEDILKSYETAEYLMAHAWYHWPMFDEALKKLLGILEMAVKFRCKALGIDLTYIRTFKDGKQKKFNHTLSTLMDQLSKAEPGKELKDWLHHSRWLRNHHAHPDHHSPMGGMTASKIMETVNLINLLFLDELAVKEAIDKTALLRSQLDSFKDDLLVLEYRKERMLITEVRPLEAFKVNGEWVLLCLFRPVLTNAYEDLTKHRYDPPDILVLKQMHFSENGFEAVEFETQESISLTKTNKPINFEALKAYQKEIDQLDKTDVISYEMYLNRQMGRKLRNFMYKNRWKETVNIIQEEK